MLHPYYGKKILLATMHKKEEAIKHIFEEKLGGKIYLPENFDTDLFGTFSGEIERKHSAYETLKLKAQKAAELFDYDYVISSEGSFGPHQYFFTPSNVEMLLFYDRIQQLYIVDYENTAKTNFSQFTVSRDNFESDEYLNWLDQVNFPSHGLILRVADKKVVYKGIISKNFLDDNINLLLADNDKLVLETDMRAMMNPTRMDVIRDLASKLANKVATLCKNCGIPGFGEIRYSGNLPCEMCHQDTKVAKYRDFCCIKCDYKISGLANSGKKFSDPTFCDFCNP